MKGQPASHGQTKTHRKMGATGGGGVSIEVYMHFLTQVVMDFYLPSFIAVWVRNFFCHFLEICLRHQVVSGQEKRCLVTWEIKTEQCMVPR